AHSRTQNRRAADSVREKGLRTGRRRGTGRRRRRSERGSLQTACCPPSRRSPEGDRTSFKFDARSGDSLTLAGQELSSSRWPAVAFAPQQPCCVIASPGHFQKEGRPVSARYALDRKSTRLNSSHDQIS